MILHAVKDRLQFYWRKNGWRSLLRMNLFNIHIDVAFIPLQELRFSSQRLSQWMLCDGIMNYAEIGNMLTYCNSFTSN